MILGYFTNKPLCLGPRFWGRFSGFICVAAKISTQKFFLVAAIYEHLVGGLVKTLYMYMYLSLKFMHKKLHLFIHIIFSFLTRLTFD